MTGAESLLSHYLAPLQPFLSAEGVTEIVVNQPGEAGVERWGRWDWHALPQLSAGWCLTLAQAAAATARQDVGPDAPLCACALPGGARLQVVLPPAAVHAALTFRRPLGRTLDLLDLEAAGAFEQTRCGPAGPDAVDEALLALRGQGRWSAFLRLAVEARRNILISGATGSGKTTFAQALTALVPRHERLITIEDARELRVPHRNCAHLLYARDGRGLAGVTVKSLLEAALRMRPDRIFLQELRDEAAFYYLRNVASGHPGSITTLHADSPALAFEHLALLVRESEAGRDLPFADIQELLRRLIDVVVQLRRVEGRFRVMDIWHDPGERHDA